MPAKMASAQLSNIIKPFCGDGDVIAWLKKVQLVAKLQKITDVATMIPLFLEGDALALYLEMSERDQEDADLIRSRLISAFAEGPFVAYEKLKRVKWTGESVDVYANKIKRLVDLAGYKGLGAEHTAKLAFITGFPEDIGKRLQQVTGVEKMDVCDLIPTAKVMTSTRPSEVGMVAAALQEKEGRDGRERRVKCFECAGPHLRKECQQYLRKIRCYRCNDTGHIARNCQLQGNERGEA